MFSQAAKDPTNGLPIMTEEEAEDLVVLSLEDYRKLALSIEYYSFNGKRIGVKGKNITQNTRDIMLGKIPAMSKLILPTNKTTYLPSTYENLEKIYHVVVTPDPETKVYDRVKCSERSLTAIIGYFCVYPSFRLAYNAYLEDPDSGMNFTDDLMLLTPESEGTIDKIFEEDVKSTVHLIILSLGKTFTKETNKVDAQVTEFTKSRLNTCNFALRVASSKILFVVQSITALMPIWNLYPKLRLLIFYWVKDNCMLAEMSTALTLLSEASLTNVVGMVNFTRRLVTTKAHLNKIVLSEIAEFIDELNVIKKELGSDWVYLRIIRPGDARLALNKYKNLAVCGHQYMITYFNSRNTYDQVRCNVAATIPDLVELVKEKIDATLFTQNTQESSDKWEQGAKVLGLDIKKFAARGNIKKAIDKEKVNEMLIFMNSLVETAKQNREKSED